MYDILILPFFFFYFTTNIKLFKPFSNQTLKLSPGHWYSSNELFLPNQKQISPIFNAVCCVFDKFVSRVLRNKWIYRLPARKLTHLACKNSFAFYFANRSAISSSYYTNSFLNVVIQRITYLTKKNTE